MRAVREARLQRLDGVLSHEGSRLGLLCRKLGLTDLELRAKVQEAAASRGVTDAGFLASFDQAFRLGLKGIETLSSPLS